MTAQVAPVLDLALDPRYATLSTLKPEGRVKSRAARILLLAALAGFILLGAPRLSQLVFDTNASNELENLDARKVAEVSAMTVDDASQIVAEGLSAEEKNAAIPVSSLPVEAVSSFSLSPANASAYATALHCLAQAIYYEAGAEPMQGRRAVAQVVLNRMRHPAYPKSVCGVVYQGSHRRTGCQFSFTCDGALTRQPVSGLWRQAQEVARAALAGYVERSVGTATHYHADYVLPKWAFSLGKINQMGRHIFYRLPGSWGSTLAFTGRYAGMETIPSIDLAALRLRASENDTLHATEEFTPGLTVAPLASDRHAPTDVGGRLDVTKEWRLNIPDPVAASARYRTSIEAHDNPALPSSKGGETAVATAGVDPKS